MTGKEKLEDYNGARIVSSSLVANPRRRSLDTATGVLLFDSVAFVLLCHGASGKVAAGPDFLDLGPYPDAGSNISRRLTRS